MANVNTQTTNILDKKKITSTADTVGNIQKPTEKDRDLVLEEPKGKETELLKGSNYYPPKP